jgi:3-oxoacyl-[acyl-carrier protein] reductase
MAQTLQSYGKPHILVNSAGIGLRAPIQEISAEQWDAVHDTLLKGTYLMIRACVEPMAEQGEGSIINLGAPVEKLALPGFSAYCAAKYGIDGLTRSLAKELRRSGIAVNALHPGGSADTRLMRQLTPEVKKGVQSPDVVTEAAIFLATQGPRNTSGEIINAQEWNQQHAAHAA